MSSKPKRALPKVDALSQKKRKLNEKEHTDDIRNVSSSTDKRVADDNTASETADEADSPEGKAVEDAAGNNDIFSPSQTQPEIAGENGSKAVGNASSNQDLSQTQSLIASESATNSGNAPAVDALRTLERVVAVTQLLANTYTPAWAVNLNQKFDATTLKRLRVIEMTHSVSYLKNLSISEPSEYVIKANYVTHRDQTVATRFFAVGTVQHSALMPDESSSRQICVAISDKTFPRFVAVLGNILNQKAIFVPTYMKGVTFGTFKSAPAQAGSSVDPGLKSSSPKKSISNTVLVGPSAPNVRPYGQGIPTFDGTRGFDLKRLAQMKALKSEVPKHSAVLVCFTVGRYSTPTRFGKIMFEGKHVVTTVSLNVQFVVLIASASNGTNLDLEAPSEPPIGVGPDIANVADEVEPEISIEEGEDQVPGPWL